MSFRCVIFLVPALAIMAGCSPSTGQAPQAPYTVDLSPSDFVETVTNRYFPLLPGSSYVYETATDEGIERIEVSVLQETRPVMGIPATVVRDTVTLNGMLIEDTFDWYAQDRAGNVWYLGEDVSNYEGGNFKDKAGSWEAGVDGALPGIIMFGDPSAHLGQSYRQEYYAGRAEDMAELLAVDVSVSVPYGSFSPTVKTLDYTPLEPELREEKFYAANVGLVKAVDLSTAEEEVLVEFTPR